MGILDRITGRLGRLVDEVVVPDEARTAADLGEALLGRGDLEAARRELLHAVALEPEYRRAWYLLGLCHARRHDLGPAALALERAGAAAGYPEALLALAEVHRDAGDLAAARGTLRRALDAAPAQPDLLPDIYRALGEVHLREGAPDRAVRELRKAAAATDDPEVHALLGQALCAAGDPERARLALERAAAAPQPPPAALRALGELYLPARPAEAAAIFVRLTALDEHDAPALTGLARARLLEGRLPDALEAALRALAQLPRRPEAHALVARVHAQAHNHAAALEALPVGADPEVPDAGPLLSFALTVALEAGDLLRADAWAARRLRSAPDDAVALAARGLYAFDQGDAAAGVALCRRSLAQRETVAARLGLGRHALRRGDAVTAAAELRAALRLRPEHPEARRLLGEAYRAEAVPRGSGAAVPSLYVLLRRLHDHLLAHREVGDLAPDAARLVEAFDRPLLVTVMGEFNSGKSTFVNALLGEEVAPMGITPTTATINVLKYGAERMGRVVYRDDRTRDVPWAEVPALLRGLDPEAAKTIRVVEVLYPLEALARVNIVDTPGLNSIIPEHEQVAREFIAQADAVVWLFAAGQAGKHSEKEALDAIAQEHKKVLGVVNKVDRVTAAEREQILRHVAEAFGSILEALAPFSAREALLGRTAGDPARVAAAHYPELAALLEERFYSRGRMLKRESCVTRGRALLARGRARQATAVQGLERAEATLADLRQALAETQRDWERRLLPRERQALRADLEQGYVVAAREVLDFARPRRWPFGSNAAAPADRDFLVELLDERMELLTRASEARVRAVFEPILLRIEEGLATVPALLRDPPDAALGGRGAPLAAVRDEIYARYLAFGRGYLRGGRVDDFFTRQLPRLELGEAAIYQALLRDAVDLEAELGRPLEAFVTRLFDAWRARLIAVGAAVACARVDVEERVFAPLDAFEAALAEAA
jgi:Tfp pilus assembly protein PilF/GTP-binding protein EngB required for normal cell division